MKGICSRVAFNVIADVIYDCFMNDVPDAREGAEDPMLYCPVCSRRLIARKCKLFCEQCGYYMSCADYY